MVPTSLLAQVDSSVGGKVGVDLPEGKNLVGAFHQPHLVVIDPTVLETLPVRHVRAGLAEAAKVAWTLDRALLKALEQNAGVLRKGGLSARAVLARVVERCVRAKARIVAEDERDGGRRQILNYGHTAGHALEAVGGYRRWIHGEAVALGMAIAARISVRRGLLTEAAAQRQERLLAALGLRRRPRCHGRVASNVFDAMQLDKKRTGGETRATRGGCARPSCKTRRSACITMRVVIPRGDGCGFWSSAVRTRHPRAGDHGSMTLAELERGLEKLRSRGGETSTSSSRPRAAFPDDLGAIGRTGRPDHQCVHPHEPRLRIACWRRASHSKCTFSNLHRGSRTARVTGRQSASSRLGALSYEFGPQGPRPSPATADQAVQLAGPSMIKTCRHADGAPTIGR
jgi:hypothetical protein